MLPLSSFESNKLRPILKCQFCQAISKNICLNVFRFKQPKNGSFCDSQTLIWPKRQGNIAASFVAQFFQALAKFCFELSISVRPVTQR